MTLWIVWAIIGIIGGAMSGRLFPDTGRTPLLVVAGIVGAVLGGWLLMAFCGYGSENLEVVSLVTSACGCAVLLWPVIAFLRKKR